MAVIVSMPATLVFTMVILVFAASFILAITLGIPVTRSIFVLIPIILHKQDPLAAGMVFAAVLAPVFGVARRYA